MSTELTFAQIGELETSTLNGFKAKELLDIFNKVGKLVGVPEVKKFSSKKVGVIRVDKIIDVLNDYLRENGDPEDSTEEQKSDKVVAPKSKPRVKKMSEEATAHEVDEKRSAAIAKSWENEETRAARSARHKVEVNGEIYNSVGAAFRALELDYGKCRSFRKLVKAEGTGEFEGYTFNVVAPEDETE